MSSTEARQANARESILASIRENLALSRRHDDVAQAHGSNIVDAATGYLTVTRAALIDNFQKNLESVGGHCHIVSNENGAAEAVRRTVESVAATRIAISDSPLVESIVGGAGLAGTVKNADPEYLFGADVGITSAQWAIAETGTLVLESEAERHRLTSLVPPIHICILTTSRIRQTLGEILDLVAGDLRRTVTFVTGASRTSDIELTLAIGVHGPRELHVILVEDQLS